MGSCYSGDHIAKDHIHTDITTCNIEEPQNPPVVRLFYHRLEAQTVLDFPVFYEISLVLASLGCAIQRIEVSVEVHNFLATSCLSIETIIRFENSPPLFYKM